MIIINTQTRVSSLAKRVESLEAMIQTWEKS